MSTPPPLNRLAVAGLIVSVSLYIVPLLVNAPVGLVLSILGLREANRRKAAGVAPTGWGLALAGIIVGAFGTLSAIIIVLVVVFVLPGLYQQLWQTAFFNG
ncbi:MAG: hypothetical protein JWR04_3166 [Rhodoglobus sp.]|nr:hypothetical protein [Rhodoglobus sp.]